MKFLTGLFRAARKRVMTTDNDMGMFRDKLTELVEKKDAFSDEEVVKRIEELKEMTVDLPDEEDKAKLERFLEDFKSVKEQDEATAKEAAAMVADLFEKLDTAAMKDVPEVETETVEETEEESTDGEEKVEEVEKTEINKDGEEESAEEIVEKTESPDSGANAEYTLEEIWQFVKKRMAEDACAGDSAEEVEEEKEKEEEVVTDHAPHISVTMNGTPAKGSLAEMFNKIKEGGR